MPRFLKEGYGVWLLAAAGFVTRVLYILWTQDAPAHPDMGSFLEPARALTHPFATATREPFFVWWLWALKTLGLTSITAIRIATALWFIPAILLFYPLAERFLGTRAAWAAVGLYTFLPSQIQSDTFGMRQTMEGVGVLWMLRVALGAASQSRFKDWLTVSWVAAALILTRITFAVSCAILMAVAAVRLKSFKPMATLLLGLVLSLFHFQHLKQTYGDSFYSLHQHTYWLSNLEFMGHPGFPASFQEWQKDPYRPGLTFWDWAFKRHTLPEFITESGVGLFHGLWTFFEKIYFSLGLPKMAQWILAGLYGLGLFLSILRRENRILLLCLFCFVLPFSFVGHVFWTGRFFVPFSPLALILLSLGGQQVALFSKSFARYIHERKESHPYFGYF